MKKCISLLSLALLLFASGSALAEDGAALFKKSCAGCHGQDGTKKAGDSEPVKGQTADALLTKLKGYQEDTFGGKQKAIMVNITKKHSAEELKALADFMGTL